MIKKSGSFLDKIQSSRPDQIFLVRGKDTSGAHAWYYVMVDVQKRETFKKMAGAPTLNLTDYGRILHSGFGVNPPEDVKKRMEEEYGFKE